MTKKVKTPASEDVWEDRTIGAQEEFAEVAPDISVELDSALDLHPISIRLQKSLVDNLKALAQLNGLGYQPLIRQILTRWVDCELKQMVAAQAAAKVAAAAAADEAIEAARDERAVRRAERQQRKAA